MGISVYRRAKLLSLPATVTYPTCRRTIELVGASKTNDVAVTGTPYGGVEKTMTTNVSHTLAATGPRISPGKQDRRCDTIVGGAVETQLRVRNTGNVQIDNVSSPIRSQPSTRHPDRHWRRHAVDTRRIAAQPGCPGCRSVACTSRSFPGFVAGDYVSDSALHPGYASGRASTTIVSRIYSTIVNPSNGGGVGYILPHNVTNTATLHGATLAAVPLTDNNDGATHRSGRAEGPPDAAEGDCQRQPGPSGRDRSI